MYRIRSIVVTVFLTLNISLHSMDSIAESSESEINDHSVEEVRTGGEDTEQEGSHSLCDSQRPDDFFISTFCEKYKDGDGDPLDPLVETGVENEDNWLGKQVPVLQNLQGLSGSIDLY